MCGSVGAVPPAAEVFQRRPVGQDGDRHYHHDNDSDNPSYILNYHDAVKARPIKYHDNNDNPID